MSKPLIKLITCESGDWNVLKAIDGYKQLIDNHIMPNYLFDYEGHSIPNSKWVDLLKVLDYEVKEECISDEDMEMGNY